MEKKKKWSNSEIHKLIEVSLRHLFNGLSVYHLSIRNVTIYSESAELVTTCAAVSLVSSQVTTS